jgi:glycosyltransferase involved in cell wall biosynthesis
MKVTFASYDCAHDISGVSSWIVRLLPLLRARGLDVHAHLFHIGDGTGATGQALADHGVPVLTAPWPTHSEAGTEQCLAWLAARLPDVYVPNSIVPAYHAVRYLKEAGVPSVGVMHTDNETGDAMLEEFVAGPAARRLDAMVTVSARLETRARHAAPADVRVHRIPCGVPVPGRRAKIAGDRFRLVYAGRLVEEAKRIGDVTRALLRAAERWPDLEAWLIGDGPERVNVEKLIAQSPARDRVRLLGRRPVAEMQPLMADCHVYVLLSEYEGLSVSMLEAMAVGAVPIVHRDAGGVAEVLVDGRNGLIVDDRDEGFLRAVATLHDNIARWEAMSEAARRTIEQDYSVQRGADDWAALLTGLAQARSINPHWAPPKHIQLPRPNAKFGWFDARLPGLPRRWWMQTRMSLGRYRSTVTRFFQDLDR